MKKAANRDNLVVSCKDMEDSKLKIDAWLKKRGLARKMPKFAYGKNFREEEKVSNE